MPTAFLQNSLERSIFDNDDRLIFFKVVFYDLVAVVVHKVHLGTLLCWCLIKNF